MLDKHRARMHKRKFLFALKNQTEYRTYNVGTDTETAFPAESFKHFVCSRGDVPTGTKPDETNIITFSPWFELNLIHKGLETFRLNDKLINILQTGDSLGGDRPILMFKVDDMSSYCVYDGEALRIYDTSMIPLLIKREVHLIRSKGLFWDKDKTPLPTSSRFCTHDIDEKFAIFCFSTQYTRTVPPLENGPRMVSEITQLQALRTLTQNAEQVLGSVCTIDSLVRLLAGFHLAGNHPHQSFMYSFCCFIAAWKLTDVNKSCSLSQIALFTTLLTGFSFTDSSDFIKNILETQSHFDIINTEVSRKMK